MDQDASAGAEPKEDLCDVINREMANMQRHALLKELALDFWKAAMLKDAFLAAEAAESMVREMVDRGWLPEDYRPTPHNPGERR